MNRTPRPQVKLWPCTFVMRGGVKKSSSRKLPWTCGGRGRRWLKTSCSVLLKFMDMINRFVQFWQMQRRFKIPVTRYREINVYQSINQKWRIGSPALLLNYYPSQDCRLLGIDIKTKFRKALSVHFVDNLSNLFSSSWSILKHIYIILHYYSAELAVYTTADVSSITSYIHGTR